MDYNNKAVATAHNRSVYASPPLAARAMKNRSRASALCAVFLRHILARRNVAHCFTGGPKLSDCRASGFQTARTLGEIKVLNFSH
jgi:hypothetical protein